MGAEILQPVQRMNEHDFKQFDMVSRMLFGDTMTEEAKHKSEKEAGTIQFSQHLAWCQLAYVIEAGRKEIDTSKSFGVRTYKSLFYHAQEDKAVFWGPNGFCSRKVYKKDNNHVRWINAIVVDIDEVISLEELLMRIAKAKLPAPTVVNQTPRGGWHVYWILKKRIKGWYKSNRDLYDKIAKAIQVSIGADSFAKSVSNYFRIPKDIQYLQPDNRFTMLKFKNWYKKAIETNYLVKNASKESIMNHAAIQELKKGVVDGGRNNAAYALAKVYQYEGWSLEATVLELKAWNQLNTPELTEKELLKRVKSAFNGDGRIPLNMIRDLSGIKVNIGRVVAFRNHAKERSERINSHFEEIVDDLFFYLKEKGSYYGSQSDLCEELKDATGFEVKARSLKEVLKQLRTEAYQDKIRIEVMGKGRSSKTKISLVNEEANRDQMIEGNLKESDKVTPKVYHKCTTNVLQESKNFRQKSKKIKRVVYSSNELMSMHRTVSRQEERKVQAPNKHNERLVGMAFKLADRPSAQCGYQYFHKVHSENVFAVDAVDPCGNVDNRRRPCGQSKDNEKEDGD